MIDTTAEQLTVDPTLIKQVELERRAIVEQLGETYATGVPAERPLAALSHLHPAGPYHQIDERYVALPGVELVIAAHDILADRAKVTERLEPADPNAVRDMERPGRIGRFARRQLETVQLDRWRLALDMWTPPVIGAEVLRLTHLVDRPSALRGLA